MIGSLSTAMQDYVKAIYGLTRHGVASTTDIAAHLGVKAASVTNMLKKLDEAKLVRHEAYRGVELTHSGLKVALEIIRHHRLIETYLSEALGYTWDEVHDEAERLEHHISEAFEEKIATMLGDPSYDPHGDPIPTKDGRIPPVATERLADVDVEHDVTITRVSDHDGAMLRFLAAEGLVLRTRVRVAGRDETGNITVRLNRRTVTIPAAMTRHIYVERP